MDSFISNQQHRQLRAKRQRSSVSSEEEESTTSSRKKATTRVETVVPTFTGASVIAFSSDTPSVTSAPSFSLISSVTDTTVVESPDSTSSAAAGTTSQSNTVPTVLGINIYILIGAIAGGLALLGVIITLCCVCRRRKSSGGLEKQSKRETSGSELWGGNYNSDSLYLPQSRSERRRTSTMLQDKDEDKLEMEQRPFSQRHSDNAKVIHLPPSSPFPAAQLSSYPFLSSPNSFASPSPSLLTSPSPSPTPGQSRPVLNAAPHLDHQSVSGSTSRLPSTISMVSSITAASDEDPFREDRYNYSLDVTDNDAKEYISSMGSSSSPIHPTPQSTLVSSRAPVTVNYSRPSRAYQDSSPEQDQGSGSVDDISDNFAGQLRSKPSPLNDARIGSGPDFVVTSPARSYFSSHGDIDAIPASPTTTDRSMITNSSIPVVQVVRKVSITKNTATPKLERNPSWRGANLKDGTSTQGNGPVIRVVEDTDNGWQPLGSMGIQHSANYRSPTWSVYERYNEEEGPAIVR